MNTEASTDLGDLKPEHGVRLTRGGPYEDKIVFSRTSDKPIPIRQRGHHVVIKQDKGDDWPYIARIECDYGDDPERPCLVISCSYCEEYANRDCLTEHEGAHVYEGCGVQEWLEAAGMEGIVVEGLEVRVSMPFVRWDEGPVLSATSTERLQGTGGIDG